MSESYSTGRTKNFICGTDYQKLWLMLFLKRAVNRKYSFRLATEMSVVAGFDDIVFRYEQNGITVYMLIQVKHKQDDSEKICVGDILTKSGELDLVKHFAAFLKVKGDKEFKGKIKDFFFVTNAGLYHESLESKDIAVEKIEIENNFLNIGDGARYKLIDSGGNIAEYLKQNKNFINAKLGRENDKEVSNDEIKGFLNELVLAVNLPNDAKLEELIKDEISDNLARRFKYFDDGNFAYNKLFVKMSNWMKNKKGHFLTPKEGEEFFRKIEFWASTIGEIALGVKELKERSNNDRQIRGPVCFNVKHPVKTFVGRKGELKAVHDAFQRSADKKAEVSRIVVISGLGGVGKSELARKYGRSKEKYYDGNIIWIDAEDLETIKNSFLKLAERLDIPAKDKYGSNKTPETFAQETYNFFASENRKSLFIFDNAERYGSISEFLPLALSSEYNKPCILITSHDRKWDAREEGDIKVILLGEFKEIEALEFVKKALNIQDNLQNKEIEELIEELQHFPLALGQAVAYIRNKNRELSPRRKFVISDYLKEYRQEAEKLFKEIEKLLENEKKESESAVRYTKTVLTTWNITRNRIANNTEHGKQAIDVLNIMAYLAPDNINIEEIFTKPIADNEQRLWDAVKLLDRYSMINLREKIVNIHRLVQKVTRLKLREEKREEEVLRRALELINSSDVTQDNTIHVTSIWEYASKHGNLIDEFYFNSIYSEQKYTPLHSLAKSGDYETIKTILTRIEEKHTSRFNKVVNAQDRDGDTPLHLAAYNGKLDVIEYLISKGANVNAKSKDNWVPLHWASHSGVLGVVKHLVSNGADVNAKNKQDGTPLHLAARMGKLNVVEYLLGKGANVDANTTRPLYNGTPLHLAAYHGELDIAKYLIGKGANVNARDRHDCTPLHRAAYNGKLDVVEYLISKGTDINAEDKDGNIPLYKATENGKLSVVEYFISKGADVNAKNKYGWTLLHGAAFQGKFDIVEYLIKKGADINVRNKYDSVPLHLAAYSGELNVVKCLISKGTDVNAKNKHDGTPLHLAVCSGVLDIVKYLVSKNVDVNISNKYSGTPLHIAVYGGRLDIVKYLIDKGANVNIGNRYDWAPLHIAAFSEMLEVTEYLIEKGADINAKNKNGDTPVTPCYYA